MISLPSQEKKLKDLIENMGVGGQNNAMLSAITAKVLRDRFEGITYDEAIRLVKENNEMLAHMPPTDQAYEYFCENRNNMLKWATALNDTEILGRHDHEFPVHALVSVDGVTVECNFFIPQLHYYHRMREQQIISTIRRLVAVSSEWSGGFRRPAKIEFVEL